jgi:hypothetical protein
MNFEIIKARDDLLNDYITMLRKGDSESGYSVYEDWKWGKYEKLRNFEKICDEAEEYEFYRSIFVKANEITDIYKEKYKKENWNEY